jgi:hypothetical protein
MGQDTSVLEDGIDTFIAAQLEQLLTEKGRFLIGFCSNLIVDRLATV